MTPNFSAYPVERLRKLTRRQARLESSLARWIAARGQGERLARLVGGPVRVELGTSSAAGDEHRGVGPHAACCLVRVPGTSLWVRGSAMAIRRIAQRLLGGPEELAAPRPLTVVERSIFALVVATALEDLGVTGEVVPVLDDDGDPGDPGEMTRVEGPRRVARAPGGEPRQASDGARSRHADADRVLLSVVLGDVLLAVELVAPADLLLRVPPAREPPAWLATTLLDVPIVVGRCALDRGSLAQLAVRSLVTLERATGDAELALLGGSVGLAAPTGAVEARVATGYVPRDMSLPDDASIELTVTLGTTRLSLRQASDLAIGQIVQLGRPLAGPFEVRAEGRILGRGELVDVDGELAVRIVSLGD